MPHVATSPADLLAALAGSAHLDGERLVIDDEAAFRDDGHPRPRLDRGVQRRTRPRPRAAQWLVWEASQALGARSASIQALYDARARGEVSGLHGPGDQPAGPDLRHGPDGLRGGRRGRRRRGHPRARPERADLHVPAPDRLRDVRPGRRDRRRLARSGLHPGRPLPVQRQEVRRRPGGDDRGDPARLPAGDRRRLPQHRHRLLDAGRPVEAERRRGAARELPARGRADRAHPDARGGRRDGQRRRRDRRGRHPELDGRGAARLPRRLSPRARRARAGRHAASPRSASRPAPRTAACRCPTAAWPRSSSTSRSCASSASSPASTAWPAPSSTARRRCPTSCSTASRRSRPPRSTSRPASRTRSTSTRPSRQSLHREIEAWCFANAADERKADQTDQQFVYTTRKKAIGPFKRQLWDLDDEGRDPRRPAPQDLLPVHRAAGQRHARRWSSGTSSRSRSTGRSPTRCRGVAAR